jgi:ABC-type amino acid transport system permease subunit
MWLDALLSLVVAVGCIVAIPAVVTVGVPADARFALGVGAAICASVLAALGLITAVLIAERVSVGQYAVPKNLRLPLPAFMRPAFHRDTEDTL